MNRRPRRFPPALFLTLLGVLLFAVILLILFIRQPWAVSQLSTSSASHAALAEDPRQIAFMSNRDGDWDLYQMTLNSGETINLTDTAADEAFPSYDFAGEAITYVSSADRATELRLSAYIMDADGSDQRRVQSDLATILDILGNGRINWDAASLFSGAGMAFVSLRDLNLEIYRATTDAAGVTTERNVSRNAAIDWFPSLSLTGEQIVFTSERNGQQEIYLAQADDTLTRLTDHPADDVHAVWLSDNRHVLFYSERETMLDGGQRVLYMLDTGTPNAEPVRLEAGPLSEDGTALVAGVEYAPGGGAQLAMAWDGNDWELTYVPQSGGEPVFLTDNDADDLFATWRPGERSAP